MVLHKLLKIQKYHPNIEFESPLLGKFTILYLVVWARPSRKLSSFNNLSKTSSSELLSIWNNLFRTCLYIRMHKFSNDSKTFILGRFYFMTPIVCFRKLYTLSLAYAEKQTLRLGPDLKLGPSCIREALLELLSTIKTF